MRSLKPRLDRGEARALSFSKEVVGLFGLYSRSLLTMLDRGEARALSFSKECQSLWLYLPIDSLCRDGRVMWLLIGQYNHTAAANMASRARGRRRRKRRSRGFTKRFCVLSITAEGSVASGGVTLKRRCTYRPSVIYLIVNKLLSLSLSLSLSLPLARSLFPSLPPSPRSSPREPRGGVTRKRRCTYRPSVIYLVVNKLLSLSLSRPSPHTPSPLLPSLHVTPAQERESSFKLTELN